MEKQSSDDALRLGAERLKTVLELSSEWYWEQDESCRFTLIIARTSSQRCSEAA